MFPRSSLVVAVPLALSLGLASGAAAMSPEDSGAHRIANPPSIQLDQLPTHSVVGDGAVLDVEQQGDTVYAYGSFEQVGRYTGPARVLDAMTGADRPSPVFPQGQVSVALADGEGGWYAAGDANGGVAHVLADGSIDPDFQVDVGTDGLVNAIVRRGDDLYLGGKFSRVNGVDRQNIAVVSAADGDLRPFATDAAEDRVTELAMDGDTVWMSVGKEVTSLDSSGVPLTSTTVGGEVHALAVGDGIVYVGEKGLTGLASTTGEPVGLGDGVPGGTVHAMLLDGDRLYLGTDGPKPLLAVDAATGARDMSFDSSLAQGGAVYDLSLDGDRLWAGGWFTGGKLTVVDAASGDALDVDVPRFHHQVNTVEVSGDAALVGGFFYLRDPHRTRGLAALDAETLEPVRTFSADARAAYGELTVAPNALYLAPKHQLGYDARKPYFWPSTDTIRAFDPETGAADAKRTQKKIDNLTGLTVLGDRLVIAQRLQDDVKFPANKVTVFQPNGQRAWSFKVPLKGYVTQLAVVDGDLLVAGSFKRKAPSGGLRNTALLRLDPRTGERRAFFDPHIHGPVNDVAVQGNAIYASGLFTRVFEGLDRDYPGLVKLDARSTPSMQFVPVTRGGNNWMQRTVVVGPDLIWAKAAPESFLDATTGARVELEGMLDDAWLYDVDGDADTVVVGGRDFVELAGQGYFDLGFVSAIAS